MVQYVESVEDPEQDTILSLLAYHSWRWGNQVTPHRLQSGPHQWSPEQTAKWDIVVQLTPEGFYILTHSRLPDTTPTAEALPLAQPEEDDADAPPPEECNWDPPTATSKHMPHRLTKRHPPHDYHATSDSRGRRTLPLQWASPEGTFTWGEIFPGAVALTYLWLRDAEAQTQAPGAHLLLTLEGGAAVANVHTAQGGDHVRANADTAVWLHANKHTTAPTMVPGSHPWHVNIVHLPTGTDTGDTQRGWADRWAHVCASLHDGLRRPSLTSYTLESAPTTAEFHTRAPPPTGVWAYTRTLHRAAAEALKSAIANHQALVHPPTITRKRATRYGGTTPHRKGAYNHQQTSLASAQISQRLLTPSPPWPSRLGRHPNGLRLSSEKRRHATTQLSYTSGDAPFIHPYRTSTSLPSMRGPSTSSCPTTPRPTRGTQRHAPPNSSPIRHSITIYRRLTSSSPGTRGATTTSTPVQTTTSTPRMSAPLSPLTPSPPTLASSRQDTTRVQRGSIHYRSPRPRAKGPPTTHPLQPTALPSTRPADWPRHTIKTTCSHASALDPALSTKPPAKAP